MLADGVLGIVGYFAAFTGCVLVWPKNMVTYGIGPNPQLAAVLGAALFPLLNELYRGKRHRTTSLS